LRPYLEKNPSQNRAGGVAQGVGPKFKPQFTKNKIKNKRVEGRKKSNRGSELKVHYIDV
jgi:hypothetical protein